MILCKNGCGTFDPFGLRFKLVLINETSHFRFDCRVCGGNTFDTCEREFEFNCTKKRKRLKQTCNKIMAYKSMKYKREQADNEREFLRELELEEHKEEYRDNLEVWIARALRQPN